MPGKTVTPENCPTPMYHETHNYCPSCSFVYVKPTSETPPPPPPSFDPLTTTEKVDAIYSMLTEKVVPFIDGLTAMAAPLMGAGGMKAKMTRAAMGDDAKAALARISGMRD